MACVAGLDGGVASPISAPATVSSAWLGRAAPTPSTPRSNRARRQKRLLRSQTESPTSRQPRCPSRRSLRWGRATCSKPAWVSASWSWVAPVPWEATPVQMARSRGAHVIATVRGDTDEVRRLGADETAQRSCSKRCAAADSAARPSSGCRAHCAYRNSRALTRQSRSAGDVNRPRLDRSARPKAVGDLGDTVHAPNQLAQRLRWSVARDFDFVAHVRRNGR